MITVIVLTDSRYKSLLEQVAASLLANAMHENVETQMVVVDTAPEGEYAPEMEDGGAGTFWHQLYVDAEGLGQNAARNVGLEAADGDYTVFLDDCHLPALGWLQAIDEISKQHLGFKAKVKETGNYKLPEDGLIRNLARKSRLIQVRDQVATGPCWGAPTSAFVEVGGFDESYCEGVGYGEADAAVRLGRTGVCFVTSDAAWVVHAKVPQGNQREFRARDAHNRKLFMEVLADRDRVTPLDKPRERPKWDTVTRDQAPNPVAKAVDKPVEAAKPAPASPAPEPPPLEPAGEPHPGDDGPKEPTPPPVTLVS